MIKYVDQSYKIVTPLSPEIGHAMLQNIENAARVCYQPQKRAEPGEVDEKLINRLIKSGPHAMFEHGSIQVHIVTSHAIANELVSHRMASYAQASTRYIKYRGHVEIVRGGGWGGEYSEHYDRAFRGAIDSYHMLLNAGVPAQHARDVLPLALATQLVMTANLREWMHIIKQHTDQAAHPDMQVLMNALLDEFRANIPLIFEERYRNYWS